MARRRLTALPVALPLASRRSRCALQALWGALLTLSAALLTRPAALLTRPAALLTLSAALRPSFAALLALIWRPRTSPLPGSALLPTWLATTRRTRRSPILSPRVAGVALTGATVAGATFETIVAETGAARFEAWAEPSRARADRLGAAIKSEVALPTKSFEPALAAQFRTFDAAEDAAQDRASRNLARVRFASVLGETSARSGQ